MNFGDNKSIVKYNAECLFLDIKRGYNEIDLAIEKLKIEPKYSKKNSYFEQNKLLLENAETDHIVKLLFHYRKYIEICLTSFHDLYAPKNNSNSEFKYLSKWWATNDYNNNNRAVLDKFFSHISGGQSYSAVFARSTGQGNFRNTFAHYAAKFEAIYNFEDDTITTMTIRGVFSYKMSEFKEIYLHCEEIRDAFARAMEGLVDVNFTGLIEGVYLSTSGPIPVFAEYKYFDTQNVIITNVQFYDNLEQNAMKMKFGPDHIIEQRNIRNLLPFREIIEEYRLNLGTTYPLSRVPMYGMANLHTPSSYEQIKKDLLVPGFNELMRKPIYPITAQNISLFVKEYNLSELGYERYNLVNNLFEYLASHPQPEKEIFVILCDTKRISQTHLWTPETMYKYLIKANISFDRTSFKNLCIAYANPTNIASQIHNIISSLPTYESYPKFADFVQGLADLICDYSIKAQHVYNLHSQFVLYMLQKGLFLPQYWDYVPKYNYLPELLAGCNFPSEKAWNHAEICKAIKEMINRAICTTTDITKTIYQIAAQIKISGKGPDYANFERIYEFLGIGQMSAQFTKAEWAIIQHILDKIKQVHDNVRAESAIKKLRALFIGTPVNQGPNNAAIEIFTKYSDMYFVIYEDEGEWGIASMSNFRATSYWEHFEGPNTGLPKSDAFFKENCKNVYRAIYWTAFKKIKNNKTPKAQI